MQAYISMSNKFDNAETRKFRIKRAISSVGRAPPLQGGGHWFETGIAHHFFYQH